jgi:uncharacterized protein YecE (DUF72 family)
LKQAAPSQTTPAEARCNVPTISAGLVQNFRLHGIGGARYHCTQDGLARLRESARFGAAYVFFNNLAMLDDARRFRNRIPQ